MIIEKVELLVSQTEPISCIMHWSKPNRLFRSWFSILFWKMIIFSVYVPSLSLFFSLLLFLLTDMKHWRDSPLVCFREKTVTQNAYFLTTIHCITMYMFITYYYSPQRTCSWITFKSQISNQSWNICIWFVPFHSLRCPPCLPTYLEK